VEGRRVFFVVAVEGMIEKEKSDSTPPPYSPPPPPEGAEGKVDSKPLVGGVAAPLPFSLFLLGIRGRERMRGEPAHLGGAPFFFLFLFLFSVLAPLKDRDELWIVPSWGSNPPSPLFFSFFQPEPIREQGICLPVMGRKLAALSPLFSSAFAGPIAGRTRWGARFFLFPAREKLGIAKPGSRAD